VTVPSLGLALVCRAAITNQELAAEEGTGPTYWEGAVTYSGSGSGVGYLEMTGYGQRMRL
jgi:predicted secreted hydrolase